VDDLDKYLRHRGLHVDPHFFLRRLGRNAEVSDSLRRALYDWECFVVWTYRGEFGVAKKHHDRVVG
jgi:hypothetical protein